MLIPRSRNRKSQLHAHEVVMRLVRRRMDQCRYGFIFRKVSVSFDDGTLTLTGCVPSFYLKQNLQELLRDIPEVKQVVNNVDVVSSCGLSSVRREDRRCS
ncbi:BON domain-containing protein [Bremerella volcania]|uniref:BON domain-containing protein n=1 Tax=Bremerella volcania TaxID=2527984 RepID=UPI0011A1B630